MRTATDLPGTDLLTDTDAMTDFAIYGDHDYGKRYC